MSNDERDILVKIAGDVGFLRSSVETLVEARLPDRMTFGEGQQKVQNDRIKTIETRWGRMIRTGIAIVGAGAAITAALTGLLH